MGTVAMQELFSLNLLVISQRRYSPKRDFALQGRKDLYNVDSAESL